MRHALVVVIFAIPNSTVKIFATRKRVIDYDSRNRFKHEKINHDKVACCWVRGKQAYGYKKTEQKTEHQQ